MFNNKLKSKFILKTIILMAFAIVIMPSCKKDDHDDEHKHEETGDVSKPVITMQSPTQMKMYNNGDTVAIRGIVTDESLHEMVIKIIDSDNNELFKATPTVHDLTTYSIFENWKSNVTDHTNAKVIILVEDHSSNVATDTIGIHIMP